MVKVLLKGLLVFSLLFGLSGCGRFFYWPEQGLRGTPDQLELAYSDVFLVNNQEQQLHGWWLDARQDEGEPERGVIYFLHGNAENISTHFAALNWMTRQGWHLFILDYRGYGLSEGQPSIPGVHQDAHLGLQWAVQQAQDRALPLVVVGQSVGGATALTLMTLAEEASSVDALVVDSAFSGYRRIAREKLGESWLFWAFQYPLSWTITDRYSPEQHLQNGLKMPLLLLHSCGDPIIPCSHSQRLYDLASQPKTLMLDEQAGHIQMLNQRNWRRALLEWLDEALDQGS